MNPVLFHLKKSIKLFFWRRGRLLRLKLYDGKYPPDFEERHAAIIERVREHTMTSPERLYALIEAVRYVLRQGIPGDFVECGVYKGGSMMAIALTLLGEGINDRDLHLFDTFEGMPSPDERDVDYLGVPAREYFSARRLSDVSSTMNNASLEAVRESMASTAYPQERIHYVKGLVEDTIPEKAPQAIALLRLDTDWYQSTKHEMEQLYPRLAPGGILIVDDYGHFKGSRTAVDEYFARPDVRAPFLSRIDYTGRLAVKAGPPGLT